MKLVSLVVTAVVFLTYTAGTKAQVRFYPFDVNRSAHDARAVFAIDVDGDGDIISASADNDEIWSYQIDMRHETNI